MCGIFCVFGNRDNIFRVGQKGINSLHHRGPDSINSVLLEKCCIHGSISHSRLAIVGLGSLGAQPKADHTLALAFNGEIYGINSGKSLLDSGVVSDTQWLWEQYQASADLHLGGCVDGIWAIVTFDQQTCVLTLMRDPMGVIPLFVFASSKGLVISSEVQAIAQAFGPLPIDNDALTDAVATRQLSYGRYVKGMVCLKPGETLRYRLTSGTPELLSSQVSAPFLASHMGQFNCLRSALDNSVSKQVAAEVPVGLQLSDGFDSTLLASTLARMGHRKLRSFVATLGNHSDVSSFVRENARQLGISPPIEVEINQANYSRQIMETLQNFDPAFSHPNFFAIQQIAQVAHDEGVKVLLCGEGVDELFRGYTRLLPSNVLRLFHAGLSYSALMAVEAYRLRFDWCISKSLSPLFERNAEAHYSWVEDPSIRHLFANYLHELLYRQNIAGMSKSVEVRAPFLDFSVVAYALQHPKAFFSHHGGRPLWIKGQVKRALFDAFPGYRGPTRKSGFALPVHKLLDNEVLSVLERSVVFSKRELGIDRGEWWKRYQRGELNAFQFERTLWPALLTAGALAATGNAL